jgi:hypothetical protein
MHGASPVYMQRAAIVAVLSFVFFLAMLVIFSFRQQIGYFILSTAFLAVEVFTLLGILSHRRALLQIFENGFSYQKKKCFWPDITEIKAADGCEIVCSDGSLITLPPSIHDLDQIVRYIKTKALLE